MPVARMREKHDYVLGSGEAHGVQFGGRMGQDGSPSKRIEVRIGTRSGGGQNKERV